ncbi:DNA recombination protein RmuC [Roseibacterium beibuensis]|uniref:DNA recombination protein RmuC n=1 Tax=[Roseibacterium] beibuensis TaxID=1193142 RepID=UPI00217EDE96|nr:DNA recombination protein RmuC [Roseibacterium beibuensis]MCS6627412.1 DNA recombination protein RmuC [Roseibacterium beibuensis]
MNALLPVISVLTLIAAAAALVVSGVAARRAGRTGADDRLLAALSREMAAMRSEAAQTGATQRIELTDALTKLGGGLDGRIGLLTENFDKRLNAFAELQQKVGGDLADGQHKRLTETNQAVFKLTETLQHQQAEGRKAMAEELEKVRTVLTTNMEQLRKENEAKLEQMRATVDEKLQATLDQRLDASFKQVSDRLESVQKGLGEMQTLATGVGDLKRVLTNVKARGTWGEVQLEALLEDTLSAEQYAAQVPIRPRSPERVDFAVRLPGHDDQGQVWLPIDCKFPHEDYARLIAAQDAADPAAVELAGKALEKAIAAQAKSVAEKYIHPPHSTDFAYLYLPTEGLFAEIVRRDGFAAELRAKYRVEVAGPSTLTALLNSLRVGFRSLQIQKKSSEVWIELGKVKTAFERYGDALHAVDKKLDEAKNKVSDVSRKHTAVIRSLRNVEAVPLLGGEAGPERLPSPDSEAAAE